MSRYPCYVEYYVHDSGNPNRHVSMVVTPCGTNTPSPSDPLACPFGQHYHDLTDSCHRDHPVPVCDRANWVFYFAHDTANPDDHDTELVAPCPLGPPTTTTTTTAPPITAPAAVTTPPAPVTTLGTSVCGVIPSAEISRIAAEYGWDSSFDGAATVQSGTALPQGGGSGQSVCHV